MKKAVSLVLAGIVFVTAVLLFPGASVAHDVEECYSDYLECRELAFNMDVSWYKMMLALTLCDVMLGKCLITI